MRRSTVLFTLLKSRDSRCSYFLKKFQELKRKQVLASHFHFVSTLALYQQFVGQSRKGRIVSVVYS